MKTKFNYKNKTQLILYFHIGRVQDKKPLAFNSSYYLVQKNSALILEPDGHCYIGPNVI